MSKNGHLRVVTVAAFIAVDPETVLTLEKLLEEARKGQVIGLAYVALQPAGGYAADAVGKVTKHPMLARGICATLADHIASLTQKTR